MAAAPSVSCYPGNRKVLAYLREPATGTGETETILCVYNLSRTAQAVELDLADFDGRVPVDLLGGSAFPPVGQLSYLLTLPPYGFYWFILATEAALPPWHVRPSEPLPELETLVISRNGMNDVLLAENRRTIEAESLPNYLQRRRWFASKDKAMKSAKLIRADKIPGRTMDILLTEVEVQLPGKTERYQLPLGIAWDGDNTAQLATQLALARVRQTRKMGYLTDAFALDALPLGVIRAMRARAVVQVEGGEIRCTATSHLDALDVPETANIQRLSAEQSNSSLIVGGMIVMKIIRRVMEGINPEVEMVRYLTEKGYANTPPLLGEVARVPAKGEGHSMIVAQAFVQNQGDAWQYTLDYLQRFTEAVGTSGRSRSDEADQLANYAAFARSMGTRLGELHALLAKPSDNEAFNPVAAKPADAKAWSEGAKTQLTLAFDALAAIKELPDEAAQRSVAFVLKNRAAILASLPALAKAGAGSLQTRVHGDFHLGQILVASADAYIIDFEGEPSKPLPARRAKSSPMRDVAGLLRSFDYAAAAARISYASSPSASSGPPVEQALRRFVAEMSQHFLAAYRAVETAAEPRWVEDEAAETALLDLFLLEKSAYEICYEAANRPAWLRIPLRGFAEIAGRAIRATAETELA